MPKEVIDALDIELLKQLIEDSRQSSRTLANKLHAHKDTIRKRIQKMCKLGIIERFSISINQAKLSKMFPSIWRVIFSIAVLRNRNELIKELLDNKNVVEIDEATPAAIHDLLIHTQFADMNEFDDFSKFLKSKDNIDLNRFEVTPIHKQHRRRKRLISVITHKTQN